MTRKVEQHIIKDDRFKDWCVKAKNLYNQSLYYWRQSVFGNIQYFNEGELVKLMREFDDESFRALPSHTAQKVIKVLFDNINAWRVLSKKYTANKITSKPSMPRYKKELFMMYFTANQVILKNGYVHFPSILGVPPMKTNIESIQCCRVVPKSNHFVVEFIYNVEEKARKSYNNSWMGIDIGLNNLATCVSNVCESFIVNGKPLKSINNFYNTRKRSMQSRLAQHVYTSNRIKRLTFRRNQKVKDYIHKSSKIIVDLAIENDITRIIIGKNINWKDSINLGKKTNREFTSIPHATLIEQIKYKAKMEGIEVITTQEAYTSKCSALDLEPICKHETYMGKRKRRGLFVTATGKLINADCNGALNIARLGLSVSGNEIYISDSVRSAVMAPKRMNISNNRTTSLKSLIQ